MSYLVLQQLGESLSVMSRDFLTIDSATDWAKDRATINPGTFYIVKVESKVHSEYKIEVDTDGYYRENIFPDPAPMLPDEETK